VDAFLVTHRPNIFYLTGFTGSAGTLLVCLAEAALVVDGRYAIQAREEVRTARVRIMRGDLLAGVAALLRATKRTRIAFEAAHLSVQQRHDLATSTGRSVRWLPVCGWVEKLRAVKDEQELELMQKAAELASGVFEDVLALIRPGVREVELAAEIEYRMRRGGASGPAFETIVASGPRSALPHARPTTKPLTGNELVVFDLGAILRGYCSDLTRTVFLGRPPGRIRRWYSAVRDAQEAARETLRPGVQAGRVDSAARRVLRRHGLLRYFSHSTGHGLGIEVHEEPRLAFRQPARIEAGNVVTLEPGVYVPGFGGIRVEDDVVVHASGARLLTRVTRDLIQL